MSIKYQVHVAETPPRFVPIAKLNAMETEGCLGCRICVKRSACVYDVYRKKEFNPSQVVDTTDVLCINCMRCVQECKKNILARTRNPQYERMGDSYWRPGLIASIWQQAQNGKIPVSGAGYRGPFCGPGFDSMWTDMSEIVRPTRDGIHGREYISTVIELGRKPGYLKFNADGSLATDGPLFVEIPIPVVLRLPRVGFVKQGAKESIASAAGKLGTFASMPFTDAVNGLKGHRDHLMVHFDPARDDAHQLPGFRMVEIPYLDSLKEVIATIKAVDSNIIISVKIPLDENAGERAVVLAEDGVEMLHLEADRNGHGLGQKRDRFMIELVQAVHFALLEKSLRDEITVLVSGGMAMAEHVAKIIACGADGAILDTVLLVALECRLCGDCADRVRCPVDIDDVPVEFGTQRIVNLLGAWHAQLIEVMGAMGLREVRRLRGELGRVMFFEDLEKDNFGPVFGERKRSLDETLQDAFEQAAPSAGQDIGRPEHQFALTSGQVKACPTRFRNSLGIYKVVRTSDCIACGKCAEVCPYGVHVKAGQKMLAPRSHLCRGFDVCRGTEHFCLNHCPTNAIRIGLDPMWNAFGDPRWTAALLIATWKQAETGYPPEEKIEYKVGSSGGGFDRICLKFPDGEGPTEFGPADVDLSVPLNRRTGDDRPDVTIGIPMYGGGMSFGSISLDTILARARAFATFDSFTCTGEGGYPDALEPYKDHVITQVATGLFGVREETIQRTRIVEFKYAQGAKPGLGGHLLGDKNTPAVAKMREAVQGFPLFSPFPFHSVYSVEDHKKHVDWAKEINPRALISVKVSGASDVDMVAVGSYYAGAHIVHLDGSYGGTGAAPDIAKKNIAMPIEYAVPKVHQFLIEEGVREEITLAASGGIRTAWDLVKIIALGADVVVIGTVELVALECIRCGACESGRGCPRGIATTDPELAAMYSQDWAAQRLVNLFHAWSIQIQHILWRLGMRSIRELVGRFDLLEHLDYLTAGALHGSGSLKGNRG
ncbi:MAG: 4Fe-4S binding protein [Anaerolineae bacterium]|nr:4Fe-4S binding protein [Anaerolineae bacterium]